MALNLRTSLIVDPSDGRIPPMTAEGKKRTAAREEATKRRGATTDAAENENFSTRCLIMDRAGPPMLAGAYNNNYQIVQTPGYVMIQRVLKFSFSARSEEHTSELQSHSDLVCRLLL